ncbi:MAG: hypothetical protein KAJ73_00570 [Zetaproteobacteria bacterium]|nr:hypothetical protein [Zetaproteobacteria bacterium]
MAKYRGINMTTQSVATKKALAAQKADYEAELRKCENKIAELSLDQTHLKEQAERSRVECIEARTLRKVAEQKASEAKVAIAAAELLEERATGALNDTRKAIETGVSVLYGNVTLASSVGDWDPVPVPVNPQVEDQELRLLRKLHQLAQL